jgi:hypothetical protein
MRRRRRIEGKMASNVQETFYYRKAIATLSETQQGEAPNV